MSAGVAWIEAVSEVGGDARVAAASARELAARYAEPHRRYHLTSHVEAVLGDASRLAGSVGLTAQQRAILALAVCAHDVAYDAQPGDDERASAAWARHHLTGAGVGPVVVAEVEALVLTTLTHSFEPDDLLAAVLSDADLAILGADEHAYDRYAAAVRQEYAAIPDDAWALGRRHVLEQLLGKEKIFATTAGFALWEVRARRNLERELASLPSTG